jgi:hypothetical protein
MTNPFGFDRNAFQNTAMPYAASMRSSSSFNALTSTVRQSRSMAAGVCFCCLSQSNIVIPSESLGRPEDLRILSMALAIPRLSFQFKNGNFVKDVARWKGAGRGPGWIGELRPRESAKSSLSKYRILSATPMRR